MNNIDKYKMSNVYFNQTIYFIIGGLSCNDIIKSIPSSSSFFSTNNSIKNEEYSHITDFGISILESSYSNINVKKIFNDIHKESTTHNKTPAIYSALDSVAIDSSFILLSRAQPNITIIPLPYMIKNNIKILESFKRKYPTKNNSTKYWKNKNISYNHNYLKTINSTIDWDIIEYYKNINNRSLSIMNINEFLKIYNTNTYAINSNTLSSRIFICDGQFFNKLIETQFKKNKINKNYNIEYGSVWKIDLELEIDIQGNMINQKFDSLNKIFPTEYNYEPLLKSESLKNISNKFSLKYNNQAIQLYNSITKIPISGLKKIILATTLCVNKNEIIEKIKSLKNNTISNNKNIRNIRTIKNTKNINIQNKLFKQNNTKIVNKNTSKLNITSIKNLLQL